MANRLPKAEYVLKEKIDESPDTLRLVFAPVNERMAEFFPGMFIMIGGVRDSSGRQGGMAAPRAFSIASDPGSDEVEIIAIRKPMHGNATHESHFVASKVGDRFVVEGPLSSGAAGRKFVIELDPKRKMALFAGGTGLAPFASLLRKEDRVRSGTDISVLYSARRPEEILLRREIEDMARRNKLKFDVTITRPDSSGQAWAGRTGRISAGMISGSIPDVAERDCYICGSRDFSNSIKAMLLSLGVPEDRIRMDAWG